MVYVSYKTSRVALLQENNQLQGGLALWPHILKRFIIILRLYYIYVYVFIQSVLTSICQWLRFLFKNVT